MAFFPRFIIFICWMFIDKTESFSFEISGVACRSYCKPIRTRPYAFRSI